MFTKTVKCKRCGKLFECTALWVYKDEKGIYCTWTCYNHRNDKPIRRKKGLKKVEQYTADNRLIAIYDCAKSAAEANLCDAEGIREACRGTSKTYLGFVWKYAPNES